MPSHRTESLFSTETITSILLTRLRWSQMPRKRKPSCRSPINFGEVLIFGMVVVCSAIQAPQKTYIKYCKRQNYRGSSLLKGMRRAEWAGKPWWANSRDLGLRSGATTWGYTTSRSAHTQPHGKKLTLVIIKDPQSHGNPISRLLSRDL